MRELKTALVADDNRISRMVLCDILKEYGIQVYEAADGKEALRLIDRVLLDLVISDILMPRCDGFRLADHIRSSCGGKNPPVIFLMTAVYKGHSWKHEALTEHHVQEFLVKPISVRVLEEALRRHFDLAQLQVAT